MVPNTTTDQELQHLRNCLPDGVVIQRVEERLSALGNCIACNDHVALVHTDLDRETEDIISDVLGVEVGPPSSPSTLSPPSSLSLPLSLPPRPSLARGASAVTATLLEKRELDERGQRRRTRGASRARRRRRRASPFRDETNKRMTVPRGGAARARHTRGTPRGRLADDGSRCGGTTGVPADDRGQRAGGELLQVHEPGRHGPPAHVGRGPRGTLLAPAGSQPPSVLCFARCAFVRSAGRDPRARAFPSRDLDDCDSDHNASSSSRAPRAGRRFSGLRAGGAPTRALRMSERAAAGRRRCGGEAATTRAPFESALCTGGGGAGVRVRPRRPHTIASSLRSSLRSSAPLSPRSSVRSFCPGGRCPSSRGR